MLLLKPGEEKSLTRSRSNSILPHIINVLIDELEKNSLHRWGSAALILRGIAIRIPGSLPSEQHTNMGDTKY
jgi:hypothetical protein